MARKKNPFTTTQLLDWMCQRFRRFLIQPRDNGGVGWCKVDCVRTTKMALALLREYHIPAEQIVLATLSGNKPLGKWLTNNKKSLFDCTRQEIVAVPGAKVHRMGRLAEDESTLVDGVGWRGHLAVAVKGRFFLDLTIDSINDPANDFTSLKPCWFDVGEEVIDDLKCGGGELTITADEGEVVNYRSDPTNTTYLTMQAWTQWSELHDQIIKEAKRRFGTWRLSNR
jgi:hypothetical protein